MKTAIGWVTVLLLVVGPGCGGGGGSGDDDDDVNYDGGVNIDADPDAPDANPNAPDADPNAPDANPNAPDAATECTNDLVLCGGECVDIDSDHRYCGNCGTACDEDETCVEGNCVTGVGTLVLSELHARQPAYFELYNGGDAAIDLEDYLIQWNTDNAGSGSVPLPSYSLGAGEFVVLQESLAPGVEGGVISLGTTMAWTSGAAVRLLDPVGVGLDFVRTGTSTTDPPTGTNWTGDNARNPGATVDQSLVRNVYVADTDTAADWDLVDRGSPGDYCPTPGRCGDTCYDFASDHDNCGECGFACGTTQLCLDGACRAGVSHLWISEYRRYPRPAIEIHNPTIDPVVMTGYRLDISGANNMSYDFPTGYTLEPGGFVVVYMGTGTDDQVSLFAGTSRAFDDDVGIALYDDSITALDFVRFGGSSEPAPAAAPWFGPNVAAVTSLYNGSAKRDLEKLDTDGNADWVMDDPATLGYACEPGLQQCDGYCVNFAVDPQNCGDCEHVCGANQTCQSGECVTSGAILISEIRNQSPEAIEIFNGTDATVDLNGWSLEWAGDNVASYTIGSGVTIPSGGYIAFLESSGTSSATVVYMNTAINWNDFIAVSLVDDGDAEIDFVRTGSSVTSGTWSGDNAPNPSGSESLIRDVFTADTNTAADWHVGSYTQASACATGYSVCGGQCFDLTSDPGNCGQCGNSCGVAGVCDTSSCVHDGDVRLNTYYAADGTYRGRPEFYYNGSWNTIYSWDGADSAAVVCHQLGFGSSDNRYDSGNYGYCTGCHYIYSVNCSGSESVLGDCTFSHYGSSYANGVWVSCAP